MKLGKEKKMQYSHFDTEFDSKEFQILKEYGLKHIVNDDDELVNYAVNKILKDRMEQKTKKTKKTKKTTTRK